MDWEHGSSDGQSLRLSLNPSKAMVLKVAVPDSAKDKGGKCTEELA